MPLLVLAFPPVAIELYYGNVNLLIALALVVGMTRPWAWTFVLLTKPTCGVGLLWFAARREWRQLGIALGVTLVIVATSLLVLPGAWRDWIGHPARERSAPAPRHLAGRSPSGSGCRSPVPWSGGAHAPTGHGPSPRP